METILNITNGDSAVQIMGTAGISGVFLPWRDVLHEGPVPKDLTLEELSIIRAQFIIARGWGDAETVHNSFAARDWLLKDYRNYAKVVLWFEHDLYDQLQILQILDWFSENTPEPTKLSIICTDQYLGMATPEQIKALQGYEETVTEKHLAVAKKAWAAFRSPTPEQWQQLLQEDTSVLPFLNGAVIRLLQEYPDLKTGLSRTALTALKIIAQGVNQPGKLFSLYQATEERRFMGDSSFWYILQQLAESNPALINLTPGTQFSCLANDAQCLKLTLAGKQVLAGELNWLDMIVPDCWLGGVHFSQANPWCWESKSGVLTRRG